MKDVFLEEIKNRRRKASEVFWKELSLIIIEFLLCLFFSFKWISFFNSGFSFHLSQIILFFLLLFLLQFFFVLNSIVFKNFFSLLKLNFLLSFSLLLPSFLFKLNEVLFSWRGSLLFFLLVFLLLSLTNLLVRRENKNLIKFSWSRLVLKGKFLLNLSLILVIIFPFFLSDHPSLDVFLKKGMDFSLKGTLPVIRVVYPWFDWQMTLEDFSENVYGAKEPGSVILSQKISDYLDEEISVKEKLSKIAKIYLERKISFFSENNLIKFGFLIGIYLLIILPFLCLFSYLTIPLGKILIIALTSLNYLRYSFKDVSKEELGF